MQQGQKSMVSVVRSEIYAAVLADILDEFGYRHQALPAGIRPLDPSCKLVGRARTGLYRDVFHVAEGENPYGLEIALIDDLREDDVAVLVCGASGRIVPWGELLTTAAQARGAGGCLTDGLVRDAATIAEMKFPVFHAGFSPLDSKGRGIMTAMDIPVEIGRTRIEPGDLIVGDADGVVVVPSAMAETVVEKALSKVRTENVMREALRSGQKLATVFERYGVL